MIVPFTKRNSIIRANGGVKVVKGSNVFSDTTTALLVQNNSGGTAGSFRSASFHGIHIGYAGGSGIYVESARVNGMLVSSVDAAGLSVNNAGTDGIYVGTAGDDGLDVWRANDLGVYANTEKSDHQWGVYTPDKIYAGTALASGGPLLLIAQNGDSDDLETGDVVTVSGMGAAFADGDTPVPLVKKAGQAANAVGVVYARFVATEEVEEIEHEGQVERHTRLRADSTEGPVAPGEYLLVVVLGVAQIKADATAGSILPGDLLTVSEDGAAIKAEKVKVGNVEFSPPGNAIGRAMQPLEQGAGLIWALVQPQ